MLGGKGIHVAMCALKRGGYDYLLDGFKLASERMRPLLQKQERRHPSDELERERSEEHMVKKVERERRLKNAHFLVGGALLLTLVSS